MQGEKETRESAVVMRKKEKAPAPLRNMSEIQKKDPEGLSWQNQNFCCEQIPPGSAGRMIGKGGSTLRAMYMKSRGVRCQTPSANFLCPSNTCPPNAATNQTNKIQKKQTNGKKT